MHRSSSRIGRRLGAPCCLMFLVCLCATPRRALAGEASAEFVTRGLTLRRERRDAEALALFQRAFAASPQPMIRSQIALAEQALGRWSSAEQDLSAALATHDGWVEANRGVLEKALAVIQSHLTWLTVTSNVQTAQLWLDNRNLGAVRAEPWRVAEGTHELSLRLADGRSAARSVELLGGAREHFHLEFPEAAPLGPPGPLAAAATAQVPAPSARQPAKLVTTAQHPHTLSTRQGLAVASTTVSLLALAEAVTASLLRVHYVERYNSDACAPERSRQCAPYRDVADTWGTLAVVGYAVAGAAAVSSVALFTSPYWYPSPGSSGTQAGLLLSGRF